MGYTTIDYIFASEALKSLARHSQVQCLPQTYSDHSLVSQYFYIIPLANTGPVVWRLNQSSSQRTP